MPAIPISQIGYERLWLEFGSRGEMETRKVIGERLRWDPAQPVALGPAGHAALAYEMLVLRRGGHVAALRDHTAVVRIGTRGRPLGAGGRAPLPRLCRARRTAAPA